MGYVDTDQAGVAHHASYLAWLEAARIEHLRAGGLVYRDWERATGMGMPVVDVRMRYRAPARFDDELEIETWVSSSSRAKVVYDARIWRGGTMLHESRITICCVVMGAERVCSIPEAVRRACE